MKTIINRQFFAALALLGALMMLAACASEPSAWSQKSVWEQRRTQGAEDTTAATEPATDMAIAEEEPPLEVVEMQPMAEPETLAPESAPMAMSDVETDIMSMPADYYTVQVIASKDIDRVYKFAEQNQLSIRYVVPTQRDGVTWHVLLLDVYPDLSSAKAGLAEVAGTLSTSPWIRKLGSVQKLMQ
ncbi:MAG: hypothetical protein OEY43_03965 [Gammaproteobacteria bacterium]|nr:hypothetical protein [Gammaproteobacteria bacterium]